MFTDKNLAEDGGKDTIHDGNDVVIKRNRAEGHVVECDGMHAVIAATQKPTDSASADYWAVGMLLSITVGDARVVGMLYKVETGNDDWADGGQNHLLIHVELVGEIRTRDDGKPFFSGGLTAYPHLGAVAHRIRRDDLAAVFENSDAKAVTVGALSQNREIPAMISVDALISRHFAVVGTTGVGKSTSVSLLMRMIVEARPDLRILVLDPHNEFATSFPDLAISITDRDLDLPFWAFRLEEFVEVIYRGREPIPEEVDILRDLIPLAKQMFKGETQGLVRKTVAGGMTADTPVPYRITDLLKQIDDKLGKLGIAEQKTHLKALSARIHAAVNDPRYRFMFSSKTIEDNLDRVLGRIFRIPANGKPITTFQLAGIPSEVVNAVVSVLCRQAFDLAVWSQSQIRTLVVCEEAHRYIPANTKDGFAPTRAAISRIAKEGRKYGVSLAIITQRPGELDPTILSQCNTVFAMRLGNDADQEIMRKSISGASRSYINFLPSLANREAIAFGQGVSTPMRMTFKTIDAKLLPGNGHDAGEWTAKIADTSKLQVSDVLRAMRTADVNEDFEQELSGGMASAEPIGAALAGEQRPTVGAARLRPQAGSPELVDDYFMDQGPLRRTVDRTPTQSVVREGRRSSDPVRMGTETNQQEERASARDLINRFRR